MPPLAVSPRVAGLAPPPVPAVQAWVRAYDGRHGAPIDLSQAVPDVPPPALLADALGRAAADPSTAGYGPIAGDTAMRTAYADHVADLYGAAVSPDEVQMTAGCNQAFFVAALATAGPGETIVLTGPNYFNHAATLAILGIGTRILPLDPANRFVPGPEAVAAAITPDVKAVALVTPNNPTGTVIPPGVLEAILETCAAAGVRLILDETYRDFLPPGSGPPHRLLSAGPARSALVQLYSFSKAFAIPGHRLGALLAPADFIAETQKVMDNLQICAPRATQAAIAETIDPLAGFRTEMASRIAARAAAFERALDRAPGWEIAALGAYFAYVRHPFAQDDAVAIARRLACEAGVVTIPGPFFGEGQERYLRMAFANVDEAATAALPDRLAAL